MKEQYSINCQVKEWYGDEAHIGDTNYGRYKMKGGETFIFVADETVMYNEQEIIDNFNKKYDKVGRFFRYEAKSIDSYVEPIQSQFINGEVFIPLIDPLDTEL